MRIASHDPVREEYSRLAVRYDRRWSSYIDGSVRETVSRMAIRSGDRVLDIGCGTGVLLRLLSDTVPDLTVFGIDLCPEMIAVAKRRLPGSAGLAEGRVDALPFADESFDIAVSTSAFHYFRAPQRALREMRRVLRVGGRLLITDWCHDDLTCRVCDVFLRRLNRAHYRAYRASECRDLLKSAGLAEVVVERYKINWFWGLMTATGRREPA